MDHIKDIQSSSDDWYKTGTGNWGAFRRSGFDISRVYTATASWKEQFKGIQYPWLCWNVDHDWCYVQQQLAQGAGWTPIVGYDPRVGIPRKTVEGAVVIDFNEHLKLPILYPHFPIEFVFLFAERLAFWHSDLLVRPALLAGIGNLFKEIDDGTTVVTKHTTGFRHLFNKSMQRHWELIGCTTQKASREQFRTGCGWWKEFWEHPECPKSDYDNRKKYYWDHATGIYYWDKVLKGQVVEYKNEAIHEGHFTKIGKKDYKSKFAKNSPNFLRSMNEEINDNFNLREACELLGITNIDF